METDESGRVLCVSVNQDGEEVKLVRYRYDDRGDMVETIDALDVSKHFVYSWRAPAGTAYQPRGYVLPLGI